MPDIRLSEFTAVIGLMIVICMLMGFVFYQRLSLDQRDKDVIEMMTRNAELLSKCVIPEGEKRGDNGTPVIH